MKHSHRLILSLVLISSLVGCSKSGNSNVDINVSGGANNSNASTQKISSTDSANFSKVFEGTINDQYQIQMNLQREGDTLTGSYFYTKHKVNISIKGSIDAQGNFTINEFDDGGNQTGVFKGRLISGSEMEGTWSKPNGDKSMSFSLKATGSGGEIASTPGTSTTTTTNASSSSGSASTSQSRTELNRETVLSLVRGKFNKEVTVGMNTSSNVYGKGNITDLYTRMIQAKIISCPKKEPSAGGCGCWTGCSPGPNSHGLRMSEQGNSIVSGSMSLTVGYKVPSEVSGISRIDQSSAYADVVFTFESNSSYSFYTQWSDAFWKAPDTRSEQHRFLLRLYDDGWRVERSLN